MHPSGILLSVELVAPLVAQPIDIKGKAQPHTCEAVKACHHTTYTVRMVQLGICKLFFKILQVPQFFPLNSTD